MKMVPALFAAALFAAPAFADDAPDLKGTWVGETEAVSTPQTEGKGEYRLVISEQNGRALRGQITYPLNGKPMTEPVIGSIDLDGDRVVLVGDQGLHQAEYDDGVLQDCYTYASKELSVAYCVDFEKQD